MTSLLRQTLDLCVSLSDCADIGSFRLHAAMCMAQLLQAEFVAVMELNNTLDRCVPIASWPVGKSLPEFDLRSCERSDHPVLWSLRLETAQTENADNLLFMQELRGCFADARNDQALSIIPARCAMTRRTDMLFFVFHKNAVCLEADLLTQAEKLARVIINRQHVFNRLQEERNAAATLTRCLNHSEIRQQKAERALDASLSCMLVGRCRAIRELRRRLDYHAEFDRIILIEGAEGTGKHHLARLLHQLSPREAGPFDWLDCRRLSEELQWPRLPQQIEQLWGVIRARIDRARNGTLFIRNLCCLDAELQRRMLAEWQNQPDADRAEAPARLQWVIASREEILPLIGRGKLCSQWAETFVSQRLHLPELEQRGDDAISLAQHFLTSRIKASGQSTMSLAADALPCLLTLKLPGNIAQLRSIILAAAAFAEGEAAISAQHVEVAARSHASESVDLRQSCEDYERSLIRRVWRESGSDRALTARRLNIPLRTLSDKLKKYRVER